MIRPNCCPSCSCHANGVFFCCPSEIRTAILDGDIDKAFKHTNAYYPKALQENPQIQFKLRCRKFLEMMRRCSEISPSFSSSFSASASKQLNGANDMEVDDEKEGRMEQFNQLLTEAVQYGQQLRIDYPSDENGGDKKFCDDIFSLVAYPDPWNSVHGHYMDTAGRVGVAEELNSAILGENPLFQPNLLSHSRSIFNPLNPDQS